ncbi:MAG: HD domain-containing protein [Methylacidiphilales bacterium]|nr:HD domain-containing protein [Candidatus Methylacidiphilales bacterium]
MAVLFPGRRHGDQPYREPGFANWVKAVRAHHDQTYQHSMLVCGSAAAFGQHLGFNAVDRRRVALAGLLHDIGKAQVDVEILSKDAELDEVERAVLSQHPELGYRVLREDRTLEPTILDAILHHHEYLDGSGYPDRLKGSEVSDLTRVITIMDIFSALIECRAYKAPLCGPDAFQALFEMGGKLDQDLVRAFQPLSRAQFS